MDLVINLSDITAVPPKGENLAHSPRQSRVDRILKNVNYLAALDSMDG
ncbi:MAG: hypothetical protein IPG06_15185 [Haliea sp.]|nr:hypothetical protein [Haliea sp.]